MVKQINDNLHMFYLTDIFNKRRFLTDRMTLTRLTVILF